jgi:hypothetical protein
VHENAVNEFALISFETVSCKWAESLYEEQHIARCAEVGEDRKKGIENLERAV